MDYIGYSDSVISYNVFAYCENNAVNGFDYSGFAKNSISGTKYSYRYSANYRALYSSYRLSCSIGDVDVFADYQNGVIKVWNEQDNIDKVFENGMTKTFSYVLKLLARRINKNCLKGRTVNGISYELICHYIWYKKNIFKANTKRSDCGATSGKIGFDDNAFIFENHRAKLSAVQNLVEKGKYNSAMIKIMPTLIRLGWQKLTKK